MVFRATPGPANADPKAYTELPRKPPSVYRVRVRVPSLTKPHVKTDVFERRCLVFPLVFFHVCSDPASASFATHAPPSYGDDNDDITIIATTLLRRTSLLTTPSLEKITN